MPLSGVTAFFLPMRSFCKIRFKAARYSLDGWGYFEYIQDTYTSLFDLFNRNPFGGAPVSTDARRPVLQVGVKVP